MKKGLVFFFFLLLFSQCDKVEESLLTITPGTGLPKNMAAIQHSPGDVSGTSIQAATARALNKPKKKRTKKSNAHGTGQSLINPALTGRASDSLFISRLKYLRSQGIEPDLNEPVSKDFLFSPIHHTQFPSMITLSRESFIKVDFDNDILDYTDRFYTNGIKIEIIAPGLQMNPLSRIMLPYWSSGTNYYGLSVVQNMFTPSTTKTGGILLGDRPYAAYLYVGSFKITNDPVHRFRQTSELDVGIIGPKSYGEWVQRSFHNAVPTNNEPLGWEYQVQNDLVLNYSVSLEKGIFSSRSFELMFHSEGNIGTLYTSITGGAQLRTGLLNPYFANLGVAKKQALDEAGLKKVQFFFFLKGSGKLVGYDATLQGGLFNQTSVYTLSPDEISRLVLQSSGGVTFSWNGIGLSVEQFILSPEFHGGLWHKWVHVGVAFSL